MAKQMLIFSKIKKMTRILPKTNLINDQYGKSVHKSYNRISYYKKSQHKKEIQNQESLPHLEEKRKEKTKIKKVKPIKKSIYDCENESWTTDKFNDRED